VISLQNLWKQFDTSPVITELNLEIQAGETLVILGRSGVGKSVLLKLLIGLMRPDQGKVFIQGKDLWQLEGNELFACLKNMGMLFQGGALFDSMTIAENTGFYLKEHPDPLTGKSLSSQEIAQRVEEALKMVGLEGTQNKRPSQLSGGMKKRAALARLIVYHPLILLYDEPTTGLDPITAMQINELIVSTQKKLKSTSIVVTHDILSALYVGDRLALMKEGKIAYIADPESFMKIDDPIIDFLRKTISEDPRQFSRARMQHFEPPSNIEKKEGV
jgi:phospholipid/cholesterol/gamma-HCH transport system ATP-binding protein